MAEVKRPRGRPRGYRLSAAAKQVCGRASADQWRKERLAGLPKTSSPGRLQLNDSIEGSVAPAAVPNTVVLDKLTLKPGDLDRVYQAVSAGTGDDKIAAVFGLSLAKFIREFALVFNVHWADWLERTLRALQLAGKIATPNAGADLPVSEEERAVLREYRRLAGLSAGAQAAELGLKGAQEGAPGGTTGNPRADVGVGGEWPWVSV